MSKSSAALADPPELPDARRVASLLPSRVQEVQYIRNTWAVTLTPNETMDDVFDPRFWKLPALKFNINAGDLIEVRSHDLTQYGQFQVRGSDHQSGSVSLQELFRRTDLPGVKQDDDDGGDYAIEFTGDVTRGYAIKRKLDGKLMKEGFKDIAAARAYRAADLTIRPLGR